MKSPQRNALVTKRAQLHVLERFFFEEVGIFSGSHYSRGGARKGVSCEGTRTDSNYKKRSVKVNVFGAWVWVSGAPRVYSRSSGTSLWVVEVITEHLLPFAGNWGRTIHALLQYTSLYHATELYHLIRRSPY